MENRKYFDPSENFVQQSKSCPPNNITVERIMTRVDCQIKHGPNINITTIENSVMFRNNDTVDWLSSQTEEKHTQIIEAARKDRKVNINIAKKRKDELHQNRCLILAQQADCVRKKNNKRNQEREERLEHMRETGIWNDSDKIYLELGKLNRKVDKIRALKKN